MVVRDFGPLKLVPLVSMDRGDEKSTENEPKPKVLVRVSSVFGALVSMAVALDRMKNMELNQPPGFMSDKIRFEICSSSYEPPCITQGTYRSEARKNRDIRRREQYSKQKKPSKKLFNKSNNRQTHAFSKNGKKRFR